MQAAGSKEKRPLNNAVRASCRDVNLIYLYLNYVNQIAEPFIQFISIFLTQEMSNFKCRRSPTVPFTLWTWAMVTPVYRLGETRMNPNELLF